ncbi:LysR family transcriptional regulator [Burkholderia gladioli]|uniref:Transcriptional regulator, LysR family n=2 Tax=Burkholderia gladioli TaxID=28095 RepID=F2LI75_BURGS|nr:LysR family transcriptional regulator [Burkholderia gladioli]AEA62741.1 transcriptional regulator, LysR family [Burkholderia gladioli BSR3]MBW5280561.1 LysR family transcriptional regulator [Burkholderia gladioli]NHH78795.1 HTH-type transcriptional regulator YofA [Burkholderia gladioli]CAG9201146.1 Transcriptional regulator, LysR family [Burkholderia gladioli]
MNTSELLTFVTVVETGNITQAAARLNRVQSSISHRIRNLEDTLDVTLLDRRTDGITPTAQGKILYDYALRIMDLVGDCKKKIAHSKGSQSSIRIGLIECLPPYIVNSLIDLSHEVDQDIDISIGNTMSLLNAYENNEFDMVIIGSGFSAAHHSRLPLFSSELVLISEPQSPPIDTISVLDGKIFLLSSKKAASTRNFDLLFQEGGITPRRMVECGSYPILFSSVSAGKGVSMVLRCSIGREVREEIKIHDLRGRFNKFQVELLYRTDLPHLDSAKLRKMIASVFHDPRLRDVGY